MQHFFNDVVFTENQLINHSFMNCTTFKRAALVVACGMQVLLATAQDHNQ